MSHNKSPDQNASQDKGSIKIPKIKVASEKRTLSAVAIKTKDFKFDRNEANEKLDLCVQQ